MANNIDMNIDKKHLIDFASLKVGDKLWHLLKNDWVEVNDINNSRYAIQTDYGCSYTVEGKDEYDQEIPVLFKSNPFPYPKKMLVGNNLVLSEMVEKLVIAEFAERFIAGHEMDNGAVITFQYQFAQDLPESPKVECKRRFQVIADYPHTKFTIGDTLIQYFFETSTEGAYIYVTNPESPLQGDSMHKDFVESMPHIFRELEPLKD